MDELAEIMAEAICYAPGPDGDPVAEYIGDNFRIDDHTHTVETHKAAVLDVCRRAAREALSALSARGLAVVPVELTPEMLAAPLHEQDACDAQYTSDEAFREAWTDMIAASPYQKGQ